ncbi:ladinin-1 [Ctenodactylus gundi]
MSVSRKNWSALSSLAQQWTLEDEEEQERERRRRHRNLSSTTDDEAPSLTQNGDRRVTERLPSVEETEASKPPPPVSKDEDEDIQTILRTRKERRQRRQAVEAAQLPRQERLETEEGRSSSGLEEATEQHVGPKKEPESLPRQRLSRERRGPWIQEEQRSVGKESRVGIKGPPEETPAPEKSSALEKNMAPTKRLSSEKSCLSEKGSVPERTSLSQKTVLEKKGSPEKPAREKAGVSEKTPERSLVSEKASIFEKASATETKLSPQRAAAPEQPRAPGGGQASTLERRARTIPGKSSPSSAEHGAPDPATVASRLPPITLQVKIPSKEEEADLFSPTQLTYSSSLKRSSPRTISFRMSPRKENFETTLTRSASMRLPASTVKLGEKLERYHTAIQRSESVRSHGSSRTEVFVAPAGVASKRHLFEKELVSQGRTDPAPSRKENLRLSGVVTSRLNLWISRTQESGDQDSQEVQKESAATKKTQWAKKSDSSLNAEV